MPSSTSIHTGAPPDPVALLKAGREALRAGDAVGAETVLRAAVAAAPDFDEAWHRLGGARLRQVGLAAAAQEIAAASEMVLAAAPARIAARMLAQSGQRDAALGRARVAMDRSPGDRASAALLAGLLRDQGHVAEARALVEATLAVGPDDLPFLVEAAAVMIVADDPARAIEIGARALAIDPDHVRAQQLQSKALGRLGELPRREAAIRAWLATDPSSAAATYELARVLAAQQRVAEAAPLLPIILRARPKDGLAFMFSAMVLSTLGRHVRARELAERGVALAPAAAPAHCALATILTRLGRYAEAEIRAREAIRLAPTLVEAHNILSLALQRQGKVVEAEAAGVHAQALNPNDADVLANLATLQWALERHDEAVGNFARALALRPDDAEMHFNRSLIHFAQGRFEDAWSDFGWRWRMAATKRRPFPQPWWDGTPTAERVLVWGEQGIGDEVLAASTFADALARTGGLVVESDYRLAPLLRRSFPTIQVVDRVDPASPAATAPEMTLQCPMIDLPMHLRRSHGSFPDHRGYLVPDRDRTAGLRDRYRAGKGRPVVGISWSSANPKLGQQKSLALADWGGILRVPGITFVNLQYGNAAADLDAAARATGADLIHDPEIDSMVDIDGFAAQVAAMDLVVTVSNSTAHFAGATGRPTWLLLPRGNGVLWYWLLSRDGRVPWYPSMRVFQQDRIGDWAGVIQRVAAALREGPRGSGT